VRTIVYPAVNRIVTITSRTLYERDLNSSGSVINATRMTMAELVKQLELTFSQPVIDNTGLKGIYQFTVELPRSSVENQLTEAMERARARLTGAASPGSSAPPGAPSVKFVEAIGLKLEKKRVPVEVVVLDKIARTPTEN
jgi:uncharacterized protein (TIGR03435 family)